MGVVRVCRVCRTYETTSERAEQHPSSATSRGNCAGWDLLTVEKEEAHG